jgi:hypothetical protein
VFPAPRDLTQPSCGDWLGLAGSGDDCCPQCREIRLAEFRYSTGEEIQGIGFSASEYG